MEIVVRPDRTAVCSLAARLIGNRLPNSLKLAGLTACVTVPLALKRCIERFPYVPADARRRDERCNEVYNIQVQALAQRLTNSGLKKVVIGVSGGLDSTQALLVACRAFDRLNLPRTNILGFTMPGFATSDGTKSNAWAEALEKNRDLYLTRFKNSASVQKDIEYFKTKAAKINTVDEFVNDPKLLAFAATYKRLPCPATAAAGTGDLTAVPR